MRRYVRFQWKDGVSFGLWEEEGVQPLQGEDPLSLEPQGELIPHSEVRLLAPCCPTKVIALGLNYRDHAEETGHPLPEVPLLFMKPSTAVIGPNERIVLPPSSSRVDYEAELAVVIGRTAKDVPEDQAWDYIWGYCCLNDVTARDLQARDGQWTRSKSFDTFCPIGPWVVPDLDPSDLTIEGVLNGEVRQRSSTRELVFKVPQLIAFISGIMTLLPGDVIATGTPSGIGPLAKGDRFQVRIEGIGVLENQVA